MDKDGKEADFWTEMERSRLVDRDGKGRLVDRDGKRQTCEQRCKEADLWKEMERYRLVDRDRKIQTC